MWTLDGTRIYVQEFPSANNRIIAELNPLNGGTTYQLFGYNNASYRLGGVVVGETDAAALKALTQTGTTYSLVTPYESPLTVYVKSVNLAPRFTISQTLRTDLDCDSTVYDFTIEIGES